ncbi:MAG: carboxypeptidase regulatory-like domain-containing protein, partial [Planctomycetes bacterium]|nr:carboxypeptidase regulatory-like domain-containing protein [Planctomycetota bacterium]
MNHEGVRQLLSAYALDELTGGQRRPIEEHLVGCLACRHELVRMQRVLALAGDLAQSTVADLAGVQAAKQVLDAIQAQPSTPDERESPSKSIPLRWLTAVAAIVLLCLSLVLLNIGKQSPGTPDPAVKRMRPDTPQPALDHDQAARNRIQLQLAQARSFFEEKNIPGLLDLLDRGEGQTQIAVADYLAQLGSTEALPLLNRLAATWEGDPSDNPFAAAIAKILAGTAEPNELDLAEPGGGVSEPNQLKVAPTAVEPNSSANAASAEEPNEEPSGMLVRVMDLEGNTLRGVHVEVKVEVVGGEYFSSTHTPYWRESTTTVVMYATDSNGVCILNKYFLNAPKLRLSKVGYVSITKNLPITEPGAILEFRLEDATVIGGQVVNELGEPVTGAKVYISGDDPDRDKDPNRPRLKIDSTQTTDANGFWQCDSIPRDLTEFVIRITHPQYVRRTLQIPQLGLSGQDLKQQRPTFVLTRGHSWEGQITDERGRPIEKARVTLGSGYSDFKRYLGLRTDPNGFFSFQGVPDDRSDWVFVIQADGYAPQLCDCRNDALPEPLSIVMEKGRTIEGRVIDLTRRPIEDVSVGVESWRGSNFLILRTARTDDEGRFSLEGMPLDDVTLSFIHSGHGLAHRTVFAEENDLETVLHPLSKISGSVFDASTGDAIEGFEVIRGHFSSGDGKISWQGSPGSQPWYNVPVQKEGKYQFVNADPDQIFRLAVSARGYIPAKSRLIDPNEGDVSLDFYLEKGNGPGGYVYDAVGRPVAGVEIYLVNCGHKLPLSNGRVYRKVYQIHALSDVSGRFDFEPQFEPEALIALCEEGFGWATAEQLDQTEQITLMPWARLSGQYVDGIQIPSGHEPTVHLLPEDGLDRYVDLSYSVNVSKQEVFHLDRLVPGAFRLAYQHFHIGAGQALDIQLDGRVRRVMGHIIDPWREGATLRESHLQLIRLLPEINVEGREALVDLQMMNLDAFKRWLTEEGVTAHA